MIVSSETYAVAIRDGADLFLFLWVKRSKSGVYAFLPRPHDTSINAHASYHADGQFHIKSHEMSARNKIMSQLKQRPNQDFVGTEHLLEQRIDQASPRAIGEKCDPSAWSEVFEIPISELGNVAYIRHVSADLVSPGNSPNFVPNARVIKQIVYRKSFPFIVLTLYEMPPLGG